ncbi:hypothetical protein [Clavibacter michiganensis]|uniref:hypothetical protein n=1 Tax=Clavibacter michiganensis TaxID=28447 RepID=UPI0005B87CBB|nr:hypothetical protein [Clavibacter michiganensis]
MAFILVIALGPLAVGVILASGWWLARGRGEGPRNGGPRAATLAAGLVLVLGGLAVQLIAGPLSLLFDLPGGVWEWYSDFRYAIPLGLGVVGLVLVAFPVEARTGEGTADLAPRTALSFVRGRWLIAPAVILGLLLIATITAGVISVPDGETGRYTMYSVDLGGERSMGTSIYGWFYSVPCLILLGVVIASAMLDLVLISRPALARDRDRDVQVRAGRARNVLRIVTGALLVHLGLVLGSLAGAASMRSQLTTPEGDVTVWTSFAALRPLLLGSADIATALGFALWAMVALTAIPSRRPVPVAVGR